MAYRTLPRDAGRDRGSPTVVTRLDRERVRRGGALRPDGSGADGTVSDVTTLAEGSAEALRGKVVRVLGLAGSALPSLALPELNPLSEEADRLGLGPLTRALGALSGAIRSQDPHAIAATRARVRRALGPRRLRPRSSIEVTLA